jgi:hypothetical protein
MIAFMRRFRRRRRRVEFHQKWETNSMTKINGGVTTIVLSVLTLGCSTVPSRATHATGGGAPPIPCNTDEARQKARSDELQQIVNMDQEDRQNWQQMAPAQIVEVAKRDLARRMRIGEIFGEGCISSAADYAAAALVFQHGDRPDHSYQTFLWSKRGVELGDAKQKRLMALGLDRYLVNMKKRQLFASQASLELGSCFCLQQVEHSFPDERRLEYTGRALKDALSWVDNLNADKTCSPAKECTGELSPTPEGTVPGFW